MNEQTKSRTRPVNTENKLMVAKGEAGGERHKTGEGEWEIQASSHGMSKSWGIKGTA